MLGGIRLSTRLALAMVSLVLATTAVLGFVGYHWATEAVTPHALDRLAIQAAFGIGLAILLAIWLAFLLARSLSRPLVQITEAVKGLSRGELKALPSEGSAEIRILAGEFATMAAELSASRQAHQSLVDSEQLAQAIVKTALDAFVQIDETGVILDWSPHAEAMTGWTRSEAVGVRVGDLIVPAHLRATHRRRISQFLHEVTEGMAAGWRFESTSLHRDGREIFTEVSMTALRRGDGYILNVFLRDITQRRATEEQLIQAQKMESVGQLTGGIAHDFNNMLTVITGTIEILAEGVKDKPVLARIAALIDDAADPRRETDGKPAGVRPQAAAAADENRRQCACQRSRGISGADARQADRDRDEPERLSVAVAYRSRSTLLRARQPRHQRPRRHARRWKTCVSPPTISRWTSRPARQGASISPVTT